MHHIQYSILVQLMKSKICRFSQLKPKGVESNLFQYHLKKLIKDGYTIKVNGGYTLSTRGLYAADHHSFELKTTRPQPKIVTLIRIYNENGDVLLLPKLNQPFIDSYHLPAGKVHEGEKTKDAAIREAKEKVGINTNELAYVATIHNTIMQNSDIISEYYGFIFDGKQSHATIESIWYNSSMSHITLAPSVQEIISIPSDSKASLYEYEFNTVA